MFNLLLLLFTLLLILINLEGCGRSSNKELSRFLDIAQGSTFEVRCQLFVARDLHYLSLEKFQLLDDKINEISRMINALNQKLKTQTKNGSTEPAM